MSELTHLDQRGQARMVDVGGKAVTARRAAASAVLRATPELIARLTDNTLPKGDAFAAARIAGILAAKRVDELIPLCHTLNLDAVTIDFTVEPDRILLRAETSLCAKTGAEMEALMAVSMAALTLYDMGKAVDRSMVIESIRLEEKEGGVRGKYTRTPSAGETR